MTKPFLLDHIAEQWWFVCGMEYCQYRYCFYCEQQSHKYQLSHKP